LEPVAAVREKSEAEPRSEKLCGLWRALSVMVREAVLFPGAAGAKVEVTVQ